MNKLLLGVSITALIGSIGYLGADFYADKKAKEFIDIKIDSLKKDMPNDTFKEISYKVDYNILTSKTNINDVSIKVSPENENQFMYINIKNISTKLNEKSGDFELDVNKFSLDLSNLKETNNKKDLKTIKTLENLGFTDNGVSYSVKHHYINNNSNIKISLSSDSIGKFNSDINTSKFDPYLYLNNKKEFQNIISNVKLINAKFSFIDNGGVSKFIDSIEKENNINKDNIIKDIEKTIKRAEKNNSVNEVELLKSISSLISKEKGSIIAEINPKEPVQIIGLMFLANDNDTFKFKYEE